MAYSKNLWDNGDIITKSKMNNIENGISDAHVEIEKIKNNASSGTGITAEQSSQLSAAYQHSQSTHAPSNAEANVQADWNITDTTSDAYIKNKPTNLVTTDQLPTVPTNVSAFTNDAGYTTETFVTNKIAEAQLGGGSGEVDLSGYVTKETGNANQITFADGQTFQAKLDTGTLKGDKGDTGADGKDGLTTAISVNGTTYTQVDGVITLPNYSTVVDTYTKSEINNLIKEYTGGKKQVYLTQAEYDMLTDDKKNDTSIVYNITDAEQVIPTDLVINSNNLLQLKDSDGNAIGTGVTIRTTSEGSGIEWLDVEDDEIFQVLVPCTGITLSGNRLSFTENTTQTLVATVTPTYTNDEITWSVNPTGIVSVSNGIVTPIANGDCVITATCGNYSATCNVNVSLPVVVECTGISLSANSLAFSTSDTQILTASVEPSDCTQVPVWNVDPEGIISVENNVVTPLTNGDCTITVSCGSQSASCSVNVSCFTTTYTITNNLTNVTSSNNASSIAGGNSYTATITANENYEISTVTITMGGVDITDTAYTNGSIAIGVVTGNIIITVVAKSTSAGSVAKVNIETIDSQDYFVVNAENLKSDSGKNLFVANTYNNDLYQVYGFNNPGTNLIDYSASKIVYPISDTIERLSGDDEDIGNGNQHSNPELINSSNPGDLYVNTGPNNDSNGNLSFRFPKDLTGYNDNLYDYIKAKYGGFKLAKSPSCLVKEIIPDQITGMNIQQNNEISQYAYFTYADYPTQNIYSGYNSLSFVTASNTNLDGATYLPAFAMSTSRLSIKFKPGTFEEFTLDAVKEYLTRNPLIFWYK